jgi:hypothetical protein
MDDLWCKYAVGMLRHLHSSAPERIVFSVGGYKSRLQCSQSAFLHRITDILDPLPGLEQSTSCRVGGGGVAEEQVDFFIDVEGSGQAARAQAKTL